MKQTLQIDTGYACFGLVVVDGVVVSAPPIASWTKGQTLDKVLIYYRRQGAKVVSSRVEGDKA
jgi:hypothetical protein